MQEHMPTITLPFRTYLRLCRGHVLQSNVDGAFPEHHPRGLGAGRHGYRAGSKHGKKRRKRDRVNVCKREKVTGHNGKGWN